MPVRTGQQYIAALKRLQPCIYLHGRRVEDVTEEAIFQGPIQTIAQLYDLQHDPRYRDFMTYPSPGTGEPVSSSFLVPYSQADVIKKRQTFKLRTDHSFGCMGRTMDFMNCLVTAWYLNRSLFASRWVHFAENAARYYEHVRDNDLFLTHVLVNPQIDRSRTSAEQEDPFLHLGRVRETQDGIVVRGAKMLGTMAPLTEEILSFPFGGIAPGDDAYGLAFAISTDTPGLKFICRETVSPPLANRFDHPCEQPLRRDGLCRYLRRRARALGQSDSRWRSRERCRPQPGR
jgi:anthranilate 3-monooxygenase (FAD)/4-hydroxyphenylacetate 3-monooxygenase